MNKKILISASLALASNLSSAAEFGVGLGLNGSFNLLAIEAGGIGALGGNSIFLPINLNKDFRVEPYFSASRIKETTTGNGFSVYQGGIGLFKIINQNEKVNLLVGGRLGYLDATNSYPDSTITSRGYSLSPSLAFEYSIDKNFVLGGELAYENWRIRGTGLSDANQLNYSNTTTALTLKYFFK